MIKKLWHSLFVQMFFNYHTMLSIGACYLLDKLLGANNIPKAIRLRLLIFFNGHPYLVPHAVAAISKEIENGTDENKIMKFVESIAGFLGAIGDQYYWNSLKPVCLLIPISSAAFNFSNEVTVLLSIASFLMYNILQLRERKLGIENGQKLGFAIVKFIKRLKLTWINQHFAKLAFSLVSICLFLYLAAIHQQLDLIVSCAISLILGFVSGRRGNSKKYLIIAFVTFILFEVFLW